MSENKLVMSAVAALLLSATLGSAQSAPDPRGFAEKAASSNIFEIQSSQMALDQSVSDDVKAFAQQMIKDHTSAGEKMQTAAKKDNITPPSEMSANEQAQLKKLQADTGEPFEAAYIAAQSAAHDEAVALFTTFSENGQESALRVFATETLPTLKMHQMEVRKLADEHTSN